MATHWHLNAINWFSHLPENVISRVKANAEERVFRDGQAIFEPSPQVNNIYILETGLTKIFRLSNMGDELHFGFVEPGEIFGEAAALSHKPQRSFATSIGKSHVLSISTNLFEELMETAPKFTYSVTKQIGKRTERLNNRMEDLIFKTAKARLASTLVDLYEDFGVIDGGMMVIDLPLTQSEMATLIGASRPTVNITFRELADEGIITRKGRHIEILQQDMLQQIAASEKK